MRVAKSRKVAIEVLPEFRQSSRMQTHACGDKAGIIMSLFTLAAGMVVPVTVAFMLLLPLLARQPSGHQETNWPTARAITILFVAGLAQFSVAILCLAIGGLVRGGAVTDLRLQLGWAAGIGGVGCIAGAVASIAYSRARYGLRVRNM